MKSHNNGYSTGREIEHPWAGVFPATLCPFYDDETIDEEGLREYIANLATVDGVKGLVCNGHTGEIMSLRPVERARVTQIVAQQVALSNRPVKTISGVSAEGSLEAVDHALAAKEVGADAVLLMPPHHWLRFGRAASTAVGFVEDVADGADVPIIVHQYPAWTKAGYTLDEMLEMVKVPQVKCIKMGTRDMSRWLHDYERLKEAAPHVTIVTCHDEYLLPTLLEGADGALVGFAGFAPKLIVEMVCAALAGDLPAARKAQQLVAPLARIIYSFGEPGCSAHQRMKCAKWLLGEFPSMKMRRPLRDFDARQVAAVRRGLEELGYRCSPREAASPILK